MLPTLSWPTAILWFTWWFAKPMACYPVYDFWEPGTSCLEIFFFVSKFLGSVHWINELKVLAIEFLLYQKLSVLRPLTSLVSSFPRAVAFVVENSERTTGLQDSWTPSLAEIERHSKGTRVERLRPFRKPPGRGPEFWAPIGLYQGLNQFLWVLIFTKTTVLLHFFIFTRVFWVPGFLTHK